MAIAYSFFIVALAGNIVFGAMMFIGNYTIRPGDVRVTANQRTSRVVYPMNDGTFCRYLTFDKQTAQTLKDKTELCDGSESGSSIRSSASAFTWGGK